MVRRVQRLHTCEGGFRTSRGCSGSCLQIRKRAGGWGLVGRGRLAASYRPLNTARDWGRLSGEALEAHGQQEARLPRLCTQKRKASRKSPPPPQQDDRNLRATAIKTKKAEKSCSFLRPVKAKTTWSTVNTRRCLLGRRQLVISPVSQPASFTTPNVWEKLKSVSPISLSRLSPVTAVWPVREKGAARLADAQDHPLSQCRGPEVFAILFVLCNMKRILLMRHSKDLLEVALSIQSGITLIEMLIQRTRWQ